ncbi:UNVERIFIED_ORG: hypothetical protein M2393_004042 [Pseudomonas psychrophila]
MTPQTHPRRSELASRSFDLKRSQPSCLGSFYQRFLTLVQRRKQLAAIGRHQRVVIAQQLKHLQ